MAKKESGVLINPPKSPGGGLLKARSHDQLSPPLGSLGGFFKVPLI